MAIRITIALLALAAPVGAGATERAKPVAPAAQACPQYGPGFAQVPGSTTCIRVSGRVRAEANVGGRRISRDDIVAPSGRVAIDTRTDTSYGPVRTFVRMRAGQAGSGP